MHAHRATAAAARPTGRHAVADEELAAAILDPHFAAVRDVFAEHEVAPGERLRRIVKTRLVVDGAIHDTERHYAACRDDGLVIRVAPQIVDLPLPQAAAVLGHECGHAVDFLYPGRWLFFGRDRPATWIADPDDRRARAWGKLWRERSDDQVEWSADAIAWAVTGNRITYCGRCMVQCFAGGAPRPKGLR